MRDSRSLLNRKLRAIKQSKADSDLTSDSVAEAPAVEKALEKSRKDCDEAQHQDSQLASHLFLTGHLTSWRVSISDRACSPRSVACSLRTHSSSPGMPSSKLTFGS